MQRGRAGAALLVTAGLAFLLLRVFLDRTRPVLTGAIFGPASSSATPDEILGGVCAGLAGLLLGWLFLGTALTCLSQLPGAVGRVARRVRPRLVPAVLQAALTATLCGSLVTTGAVAAGASDTLPTPGWVTTAPGPAPATTTPPTIRTPDPGWTPSAAPARPHARPEIGLVSAARRADRQVEDHVSVRRGDTLWTIAARHLGPEAGPSEVAREWPRWYAANRPVIGADPDLLQPGQLLCPPPHRGHDHRASAR
jgi:hypothetical protein